MTDKHSDTVIWTDDAKVLGSRWFMDIPLKADSDSAHHLRAIEGQRVALNLGVIRISDARVILVDVRDGVETWRVYKTQE